MNIFFVFIFSIWINYGSGIAFYPEHTLSFHPEASSEPELILRWKCEIGKRNYGFGMEAILREKYKVYNLKDSMVHMSDVSEHIFIFSFVKMLKLKNFDILFSAGPGAFVYEGPLYHYVRGYCGSATSFIGVSAIHFRKRVKNTNLVLNLSLQGFYTIIRNKKTYWFNGYAIFFDLTGILKE